MPPSDADILEVQRRHAGAIAALFAGQAVEPPPAIVRIAHNEYLGADDASLAAWLAAVRPAIEAGWPDAADADTFRPLVVEFWPLGVHYVDALFGGTVRPRDGNFWTDTLSTSLADLAPVDLAAHPLVAWTLRAMRRILDELPEAWQITTPVLSCPINIAMNLFGQGALADLADPSAATLAGLGRVADAIAGLHRLMIGRFGSTGRVRFYASSHRWAPEGFGHICGCATQLIGPATYARHLGPLDAAILGVYPAGGTIHLCGHHTQHIGCWRDMKALRGVQLNDAATDDLPAYFAHLRDDQILYVTPTAATGVEKILDISGGRRIILQTRLRRP